MTIDSLPIFIQAFHCEKIAVDLVAAMQLTLIVKICPDTIKKR